MTHPIENVLSGLLASIHEEQVSSFQEIANNPAVEKALNAIAARELDAFYFALPYPVSQTIEGLLRVAIPTSDCARFIFLHSNFIESHFQKLIVTYEGGACCADKSRTILRRLLAFYLKGERISFDWTQQYTYHYPKTIFTNHEDIVGFFEALRKLYYGNAPDYIAIYTRITNGLTPLH